MKDNKHLTNVHEHCDFLYKKIEEEMEGKWVGTFTLVSKSSTTITLSTWTDEKSISRTEWHKLLER
jgi:hypothetical protein